MAVSHSTVLSLLGKQVSFYLLLDEHIKLLFPEGVHVKGCVYQVIIDLNGDHQILVDSEYFQISKISLIL